MKGSFSRARSLVKLPPSGRCHTKRCNSSVSAELEQAVACGYSVWWWGDLAKIAFSLFLFLFDCFM